MSSQLAHIKAHSHQVQKSHQNNSQTFKPQSNVTKLVIYADNDLNFIGQRAAYALAARLEITVEVMIPDIPGADWLDVLNARRRRPS